MWRCDVGDGGRATAASIVSLPGVSCIKVSINVMDLGAGRVDHKMAYSGALTPVCMTYGSLSV